MIILLSLGLALGGLMPSDGATTILKGHCLGSSQVATGATGADLTKNGRPFACDSAVVTFYIGSNRVLIQFINKRSSSNGLVGFAGTVSAGEIAVDHFYLNDGRTLDASQGFCRIHGTGSHIQSIVCAMRADRGDLAVGALVGFDTAGPKRGKR